MKISTTLHFSAAFTRSEIPGVWMAYAMDFDVVTQGNSLEDALEMLIDATSLAVVDDMRSGRPHERQAPDIYLGDQPVVLAGPDQVTDKVTGAEVWVSLRLEHDEDTWQVVDVQRSKEWTFYAKRHLTRDTDEVFDALHAVYHDRDFRVRVNDYIVDKVYRALARSVEVDPVVGGTCPACAEGFKYV